MDIARFSAQAKAKQRILPPAQFISQASTNLIAFVDEEHGYVRARLGGPVWDNFMQKMKNIFPTYTERACFRKYLHRNSFFWQTKYHTLSFANEVCAVNDDRELINGDRTEYLELMMAFFGNQGITDSIKVLLSISWITEFF